MLLLLLAALNGCGGDDPLVLRVGPLAFGAEVRTQLPANGLPALGDVAAWGLAVKDGIQDSILGPLGRRAAERSRLQSLPYLLGAMEMGIGEDGLRAAYEEAPEWELEVRHVVRLAASDAPMTERLAALEVAEEILRRAQRGEDFAALAATYSEEPGAAERGGLLEAGREGSWVDAFWAAAAALQPGEIGGVVETEYGFHVLRLDARRPVPFAEADRARLLRRLIPEDRAAAAMSSWIAGAPDVPLAPDRVTTARAALAEGVVPLGLVLAQARAGVVYTGEDLAAAWAEADTEQRRTLLRDEVDVFTAWLATDVQEGLRAGEAARLGAPVIPVVGAEALDAWRARALGWTATFRFSPSLSDEALRAAAVAGAGESGQDYRISRAELEGIRPLLRAAYPVVAPSAVEASASSSEIPNIVSTG